MKHIFCVQGTFWITSSFTGGSFPSQMYAGLPPSPFPFYPFHHNPLSDKQLICYSFFSVLLNTLKRKLIVCTYIWAYIYIWIYIKRVYIDICIRLLRSVYSYISIIYFVIYYINMTVIMYMKLHVYIQLTCCVCVHVVEERHKWKNIFLRFHLISLS